MANSLKKQTQGDAMNLPPGIDRLTLKDGTPRYRVRIRISDHKPISKSFKNLTHAKQWKRITEGQIEKGLYVSFSKADQHTVSQAIIRYRKEILPSKTKDGHNVARHLDRWEKELGHLKLSRLNPSTIAEVRDRMLSENIHPEKLRSTSTVSRYLASFSHVLSTATREWQWLHENPCLKVRKPKAPPGRIRYLSREEITRLAEACKKSQNPDLYLIFLIALTTGARKSEILLLKGCDVDLENQLFLLSDTKNSESRTLPISEQVFELIKNRPMTRDGFLFPSPENSSQPICIRSAWEKSVQRADLRDFRFHDIRHTTASYLTMGGSSTREVAEILGHKSVQTTQRYSHLANIHKKKVINAWKKWSMKNLNENEIFTRLSHRWEDHKITHKKITNPDYEVWGRAREWEHHQAVCLLAGMLPLSKPYFDLLISDRSTLDFVHWIRYYPFKSQDQNRLINIDRLLKTLIPDTKLPIQPQALLAHCKSHIGIAQSIPEPLITVIEQFGPHPSLNLPNAFTSLELDPRVFINLKKLEENQKKPQVVIPNAGIPARVSPPPKPAESPLAIAKRLFPLKNKEKWEKADAFSVNEIVLLHYGIDPDAIPQQPFSRESENENSKEFAEYLNRHFYGERQLFISQLDEKKVIDLLRRSFYSKSLQLLDQNIISRTEIVKWMRSKNLSFPIQDLPTQEARGKSSKEDLLNYDLKHFDKDQLARLMVRCGAAAEWKETPSSSPQKCKKSALVKDAIKLANLVGKKSKPYSDKVIADWIHDLNPKYKPKK